MVVSEIQVVPEELSMPVSQQSQEIQSLVQYTITSMNNALYTIVFFILVITVILAGLASHSFKGFLKCLWGIAMGGANEDGRVIRTMSPARLKCSSDEV